MYYGVTRYGEKAARCHSAAPAELFQHSLYIRRRRRRHTEAGLNHLIRRWAGLWLFRSVLRRLQLSRRNEDVSIRRLKALARAQSNLFSSTIHSWALWLLHESLHISNGETAGCFAASRPSANICIEVCCRVASWAMQPGLQTFFPTDGSKEGLSLIFYVCFHSCSFLLVTWELLADQLTKFHPTIKLVSFQLHTLWVDNFNARKLKMLFT